MIYHATLGVVGYAITKEPLFLVGSVIPDFALIYNEAKLRIKKIPFDDSKVDSVTLFMYRFTHSLLFLIIPFMINFWFGVAWLIHQLTDWFTHVGVFSTMPLFPLSKKSIKFGRNILK